MNDERARRVGQNEALYRLVNEQIESVNEGFGAITDDFAVICECGNLECHAQLTVKRSAYEQIRADPAMFVLKPGHQLDDVEDVVETTGDYVVVVKKPGEPARVATQTDPRT
jgi:hypothetical protein